MRNSIYSDSIEPWKSEPMRVAYTVGGLIEFLQQLPPRLPIDPDQTRLAWVNIGIDNDGHNGEHLSFRSEDE